MARQPVIVLRLRRLLPTLIAASSLAAAAAPVTFEIEGSHTYPRFAYRHLGLSTQLSRFNVTSGRVTLDQAARTGSVEVTVDLRSVDTGSAEFDAHIQGPDFLDTARHPFASFRSRSVRFRGDQPAAVDGVLTIKGISHPVTLDVTRFRRGFHPLLRRDAIGANATATISRSAFDAGRQVPVVGDEVTLDISLEAIAP
jgi:polyisoprenoid-binding protein YceI